MRIKDTFTDRVTNVFCYAVVILVCLICFYPLWLVLIYSMSDPEAVNAGEVWIWPVGMTWDAYKEVFARDDLMKGYFNTITQTLFGTAVNMILTIPAAYALSKRSEITSLRNSLHSDSSATRKSGARSSL